jgi:hypothetical protein
MTLATLATPARGQKGASVKLKATHQGLSAYVPRLCSNCRPQICCTRSGNCRTAWSKPWVWFCDDDRRWQEVLRAVAPLTVLATLSQVGRGGADVARILAVIRRRRPDCRGAHASGHVPSCSPSLGLAEAMIMSHHCQKQAEPTAKSVPAPVPVPTFGEALVPVPLPAPKVIELSCVHVVAVTWY